MLTTLKTVVFTVMATIALTAITCFTLFGLVYLVSPAPRRVVLWQKFKDVTHKIGLFNTWVILSIFYWLVMLPYAVLLMPFMDPMRTKKTYGWLKRSTRDLTLEDAGRQF